MAALVAGLIGWFRNGGTPDHAPGHVDDGMEPDIEPYRHADDEHAAGARELDAQGTGAQGAQSAGTSGTGAPGASPKGETP
ncbi:hypothetical protein ART_2509 [Arthrobacter sp. PAMC 25486]|nr:hypothetical protein ART_2509 [Arthrobacter sp. PAMC 25486]